MNFMENGIMLFNQKIYDFGHLFFYEPLVGGTNPSPSGIVQYEATIDLVEKCTGNVTFTANGQAIAFCYAVVLTDGSAICKTAITNPASYDIVATYNGSSTCYTATSQTITQGILPAVN